MKAVILAGGRGSRIEEESRERPKPMVEIGGRPLLWHIMELYARHGIEDFIVCLGYKGFMIKEYFANLALHQGDVTFDFRTRQHTYGTPRVPPWRVSLVDTGEHTETGGRVKRVRDWIGDGDFCLTYGDGLSSVDIARTIAFHRGHGRLATVTAVRPPGRFGALELGPQDRVTSFVEKPLGDGGWINGGFFVLSPGIFDFIDGDDTKWEDAPLRRLVEKGELAAFRHDGFWQPLDTVRDKLVLESLWKEGGAPWLPARP